MNSDLLNTIILAGAFLCLFSVAEFLFHFLKVKVELTRKLVHLGTGVLTLLFPLMLDNHWLVLLLCSSFALILVLSLKYNLLKSINAIDRESVGSIAYPVAVYITYLFYDNYRPNYIYFYLPILILAICDPLAALLGKKFPLGKYKVGKETKTIMGSSAFFVSAFSVYVFLFSLLNMSVLITYALIISIVATITEALSKKGFDNITIPFSVIICLYIFAQF